MHLVFCGLSWRQGAGYGNKSITWIRMIILPLKSDQHIRSHHIDTGIWVVTTDTHPWKTGQCLLLKVAQWQFLHLKIRVTAPLSLEGELLGWGGQKEGRGVALLLPVVESALLLQSCHSASQEARKDAGWKTTPNLLRHRLRWMDLVLPIYESALTVFSPNLQ